MNEFTEAERQQLIECLYGGSAFRVRQAAELFMVNMALSNTVLPFEDEKTGELKFQAESAEEAAMVEFARSLGFVKRKNNPTILEITNPRTNQTNCHTYHHLATCGFNSKRARVTVIYREERTGDIHIMCKGADSVVIPLTSGIQNEEKLLIDLKEMASNGLRTLVCAHAVKPASWWSEELEVQKISAPFVRVSLTFLSFSFCSPPPFAFPFKRPHPYICYAYSRKSS